jgi:hypothetical protein
MQDYFDEIDFDTLHAKERLLLMVLDHRTRLGSLDKAIEAINEFVSKLEFLADTPEAKAWVGALAEAWDRDRPRLEKAELIASGVEQQLESMFGNAGGLG